MSRTGFDFVQFIESVRPFRFLYDRNCPEFKDTSLKTRTWHAIGTQYGIAAPDAQKKWANLKDKYMRLKKELLSKSKNGGKRAIESPRWAFYHLMDDVYTSANGMDDPSQLQFVLESNSSSITSWQDNISIHEEADASPCESPVPSAPSRSVRQISNGRLGDDDHNKRPKTEDEIVQCIQSSTQALHELSDLRKSQEDGPHYFCMWIADRMRSLSQMKQNRLQHAIHDALTHVEMEEDDQKLTGY